jgi:transcription initiation factor TFIIIB Brf1 subunit/transcription initiation factor TFIIB
MTAIELEEVEVLSEIDQMWQEFDSFRGIKVVQEGFVPKKSKGFNICACGFAKVTGPDNLPVCLECGLVESMYIDESPEWTSGVDENGVSSDPSRCGNLAVDQDLFSCHWGTGTVISTQYKSSYAMRRMARINFHSSMNHKDRSLFHAYKDIDEAANKALNLSDTVIKDAKMMYRKFNGAKLTRGAIRLGIKANCVLYACKLSNFSKTTKDVADAFGIPTKDISRTSNIFRETILSDAQKSNTKITRPADVINNLLNVFNISDGRLRMKCVKMCKHLEECVPLMGKTPTSIASIVILMVLGEKTSKPDICTKCNISMPTLNKIEALAKAYLEENPIN